ncbi:MAG: hypothetical protein L0287_18795 [Anaerolineae bacterium]|nr:hypothetical protein [Anaerolineae bacterium]
MKKKLQGVFLFLFLIGCSSNETVSPTIISDILPTSSPLVPETVAAPVQTFTPTVPPAPIFTSAPTLEPLPTLSSTGGEEQLRIWIQGTFECLLPCWGGITPGKTSWQEARQIVEQLSGFSRVNVSENLSCDFGGCNGIAWSLYPQTVAEGAFYTKFPENTMHLIKINIQNEGNAQKINLLRNIGLQEVFRWYGLPPIFLLYVEMDQSENRFMELVLVYPERQSIIRYTKNTDLVDGKVTNCGQDQQIEFIILDNKDQLMSMDAIASAVETKDLHINSHYKTVEEATGITPNSLYDAISAFSDFCISTPVEMWTP